MIIILGILATARVTELLTYEKIFASLREYFGIYNNVNTGQNTFMDSGNKLKDFVGNMLSCFSCTSVWVALFVSMLYFIYEPVFYGFAIFMTFSYVAVKLDTLDDFIKSIIHRNYK